MKMYLSSYHLGNNPQKLVDMVGKNKETVVISNALDFLTDISRRNESAERELNDLRELGLEPEEFDLRNYFGKPKKLEKDLSKYSLIWVRGGNAFILRKAYKESGFDKWLKNQKDNKELIYAGYSAGGCVLAPTLKGLEIVDDQDAEAKGYKTCTIWEGLGLIDFAFVPHYMSDHPESENVTKVVEYYKKNKVEYKTLHDGEVIILEI